MNDLDKKIKAIVSEELEIPEKYDAMILKTLKDLPDKQIVPTRNINKFKVSFAAACCGVFLATSVVFADEIVAFFKHIFNFSRGIDKAVQSGYIENINIQTIKSNGTVITAENFLMDDYNLSFTFKVNFENEELLNKISKIEFLDMIVTDEENNILYCEDEDKFNEYCSENNLDYTFWKFNDKNISCSMNKITKNRGQGNINIIYNLYANKFPRSKKLFINFSKIKCLENENINQEIILEEDWNIEIDVPEKFYNREGVIYTVTSCSEPSIDVTEMIVYNTGTKLELIGQFEPIYNEDDTEEMKETKLDEFFYWNRKNIENNLKIINNIFLEDENGNKYYEIMSNSGDKNIMYEVNGRLSFIQTFDLIKYEEVNKIKIYFNLNLPNSNKDVIIELERNN